MLEVINLEKSFGGIRAVDGCTFAVENNTITGLIGPNGAGKTTVFNLISGFYSPDGGKIVLNGSRIDQLPAHRVPHLRLSRTFQITRELGKMTVIDNLMVAPLDQMGETLFNSWFRLRSVKRQERKIREKALYVLDFLEIPNLKDEYASNLSGGQKKLLEFGRTMMTDPEIILLDEPGAGVNPTLMKKLNGYIERLRGEEGVTFFLIEHDMDLVMKLCDPIIVMNDGKVLAEGTAVEIQKNRKVLDAYLGG
ncbi:ABC transporter ATP-binding protein [Candidatus Bipolaricaulota bacterium]|nr:ABC transporter ATP-binding protein [Candidatus Bipolaricaulota bacterium]